MRGWGFVVGRTILTLQLIGQIERHVAVTTTKECSGNSSGRLGGSFWSHRRFLSLLQLAGHGRPIQLDGGCVLFQQRRARAKRVLFSTALQMQPIGQIERDVAVIITRRSSCSCRLGSSFLSREFLPLSPLLFFGQNRSNERS